MAVRAVLREDSSPKMDPSLPNPDLRGRVETHPSGMPASRLGGNRGTTFNPHEPHSAAPPTHLDLLSLKILRYPPVPLE